MKTVPRTFRTPQPLAKRLAAFVKHANKKHPGLSKPKVSQTSTYLLALDAYLFQHGF